MPSIYRPTYTVSDKRTGERVTKKARVWWGQWRDAKGKLRRASLKTASKIAAQLKLADLVRAAQRGQDDTAPGQRQLPELLASWESDMVARGTTAKHVRITLYRVRRVVEGCGWRTVADLDADAANRFLASLQVPDGRSPVATHRRETFGIGAKTRNDYVDALRAFGRRLGTTAFAKLQLVRESADRRHDRRPLTESELLRLFAAAEASGRSFRGLDGRDRYHLYLTAAATGFRVGELAALTPAAFCLEESPPTIKLGGKHTKNKRAAIQPIAPQVVPLLRAYLAGRDAALPVWPGTWEQDASEMVRGDLEEAGIPYAVEGPDGLLFADAHALRHSFIALLDRPGVTMKQAMSLARHSDPRLTMKIYGRARLSDLAAAATEAAGNLVPLVPPLVLPPDGERGQAMASDGQDPTQAA